MFRPNRIGTPKIHNATIVSNNTAFSITAQDATNVGLVGQVINATPTLDFGEVAINWVHPTSTVNVPVNNKWGIVQQFTVTAPLAGQTVGIEINAALNVKVAPSTLIVPVFGKLAAAAGGILQAFNIPGTVTAHSQSHTPIRVTDPENPLWIHANYTSQFITYAATAPDVAGIYAHGFALYNNSTAVLGIQSFLMSASIRQLNDQQLVGYRDTLR